MESAVQQKILKQFVNKVEFENSNKQPNFVNINPINTTNNMNTIHTLVTNDNTYFIRYGGFSTSGSYNAIEVYTAESIENNQALYIFDDIKIGTNSIYISQLREDEDGRFYAVGNYISGTTRYNYLIIFNNFIQDGYLKINKYYSASTIGTSDNQFYSVLKVPNSGIYYIETNAHLIRFEINIIEGNNTSIASFDNHGIITSGSYQSQLSFIKGAFVYTRLWLNYNDYSAGNYVYEYQTGFYLSTDSQLPASYGLYTIMGRTLTPTQYIEKGINYPWNVILPYYDNSTAMVGENGNMIRIVKQDNCGGITEDNEFFRTTLSSGSLYCYVNGDYIVFLNGSNIELYHKEQNSYEYYRYYTTSFNYAISNIQILKQNNLIYLIGTTGSNPQKIVFIKVINSLDITTEQPYFNEYFAKPHYLNLYSKTNDDSSLIFSKNRTALYYSGKQITASFIVPNYSLNSGNIKKASVYGESNYLLNHENKNISKNIYESLYFKFIYQLNIINNTNGLNELNQIGSNNIAKRIWYQWRNYSPILTKARITYKNLNTSIINLNIPEVTSTSVTFSFQTSGNVVKIEYLSDDEKTVYATYRCNLTGTHTITQTINIE